jgi:hypothetical protein
MFRPRSALAGAVHVRIGHRVDWYSAHDWKVAYRGDPKIYPPDQVPGRNLPAAFIGNN